MKSNMFVCVFACVYFTYSFLISCCFQRDFSLTWAKVRVGAADAPGTDPFCVTQNMKILWACGKFGFRSYATFWFFIRKLRSRYHCSPMHSRRASRASAELLVNTLGSSKIELIPFVRRRQPDVPGAPVRVSPATRTLSPRSGSARRCSTA